MVSRGSTRKAVKKERREDSRYDAGSPQLQKRRPRLGTATAKRHGKNLYTPTEMERYHKQRVRGQPPRYAREIVERRTTMTRRSRQYQPKPKPSLLKQLFG